MDSAGCQLQNAKVQIRLPQVGASALDAVTDADNVFTDDNGNFAARSRTPLLGATNFDIKVTKRSHGTDRMNIIPPAFVVLPPSSGTDPDIQMLPVKTNWEQHQRLAYNEPPSLPPPPGLPALGRPAEIAVRSVFYPWTSSAGIPRLSGRPLPSELPPHEYLVDPPSGELGFFNRLQRDFRNNQSTAGRQHESRLTSLDAFRKQYDKGGEDYAGLIDPPMPIPSVINAFPPGADGFPTDASFAWQRLAGMNPFVLKLLTEFPKDDFPIRSADLRPYFNNAAELDRAMAEKRLYIADYEFLANVFQTGDRKYLPTPFALFYYMGPRANDKDPVPGAVKPAGVDVIARDDRAARVDRVFMLPNPDGSPAMARPITAGLAPVAIQIERKFDATINRIFTPRDGIDSQNNQWGMAKLMVQIADLNHHETKGHIAESHLAMEAFKVAMERTLSARHPLYQLLEAHFQGLLAINWLARHTLVAPGGGVEHLLANSWAGSTELVKRAYARWNFQSRTFRSDLSERGLLDADSTIPNYPYRDDGLRVWNVIRAFVSDYLDIYYANDNAVASDARSSELGSFLGELNAPTAAPGDAVPGVPGVPRIATRDDLGVFVTDLIFNSSARHAALNYGQYDFAGFIPNMPGTAVKRPFRDDGSLATNIFDVLPDANFVREMVELMANLSLLHFGTLGTYPNGLGDGDGDNAAKAFRAALDGVKTQIAQANADQGLRPKPYTYLLPDRIPASTNI